MARLLAIVPVLAACTTNDRPSLELAVTPDGVLQIALARAPTHEFEVMTATANGIDCGTPTISGGVATFAIAMAQLGDDVAVAVGEGRADFALHATALGRPRELDAWSLGGPIGASEWLVFSDNATDQLSGTFQIVQAQAVCSVPWATRTTVFSDGNSGLELETSPDLAHDWFCGAVPAPGAMTTAQLAFSLDATTLADSCTGPDLACPPIRLPSLHGVADVTVQF